MKKSEMVKNIKAAILVVLALLGLSVMLIPVFSNYFPFSWGLLGAVVVWVLTYIVSVLFKKSKSKKK